MIRLWPLVPLHGVRSFTVRKDPGAELLGIVLKHERVEQHAFANVLQRSSSHKIFVCLVRFL
jgi:hypothetical protein